MYRCGVILITTCIVPVVMAQELIFTDGFESGNMSAWSSFTGICGDGTANTGEECDGNDLGGMTCTDLGYDDGGVPQCTSTCQFATITCPGTHSIAYGKVDQQQHLGDLRRVRWHPSGRFALILTDGSSVLRYEASTGSISTAADLGATAATSDLDVALHGGFFLIVGTDAGAGQIWRVRVETGDVLVFSKETAVPNSSPVAIEVAPEGDEWAIAATVSDTANYIHLWKDLVGVHVSKLYVANGGAWDLMWGDPTLFFGSRAVIIGHGVNGADSKTYYLDIGEVLDSGWPPSFGNAGGAGWRPSGGYGIFTGWSSNVLYVFEGTWSMTTLPDVGTAASPQAIGWRRDGTRAVVVGRAIGPGLKATVTDHRPGVTMAHDPAAYVDASIPGFDLVPWFGNSDQYLLDADWRPGSTCDEGLIVGSDAGELWDPLYGLVVRFYDSSDGDCIP